MTLTVTFCHIVKIENIFRDPAPGRLGLRRSYARLTVANVTAGIITARNRSLERRGWRVKRNTAPVLVHWKWMVQRGVGALFTVHALTEPTGGSNWHQG